MDGLWQMGRAEVADNGLIARMPSGQFRTWSVLLSEPAFSGEIIYQPCTGAEFGATSVRDGIVQMLQAKAAQGAEAFLRCLQMLQTAMFKKAPLQSLGGEIIREDVLDESVSVVRAGCDYPLPPPLPSGDPEEKDLDKEIANALAEPNVETSDALAMLFLRVEPDYLTVVKAWVQHWGCNNKVWGKSFPCPLF
ncbi:unnamed protein product [Symbiodinium sp. CCMP2456]|nr:unnamed protein product [Symbiodinium sp. CCMP2456]